MSTSYRDRAKAQAAEGGGFRPHATGTFDGVIEEIREREHNGQTVWDVVTRTNLGTAKMGIWKTVAADIDGRLTEITKNRAEAEERYIKHMGRLCRLYTDLGLEEPAGTTDDEFETAVYDRLGELIGRACKVVVQANPANADNPRVYINAPRSAQPRSTGAKRSVTRVAAPAAGPSSDPFGSTDGDLSDVPF